jgi:hypothetical protein
MLGMGWAHWGYVRPTTMNWAKLLPAILRLRLTLRHDYATRWVLVTDVRRANCLVGAYRRARQVEMCNFNVVPI